MILTVTLNAAIDKRYVIKGFEVGEVNRVACNQYSAGGKGLNVSRVAAILGSQVTAGGFVGGHAGAYIEEEIKKQGIETAFYHVEGESRSCINIYDEVSGVQTEVLETGIEISAEQEEAMIAEYDTLLDTCDVVALSGSVPKGVSDTVYQTLVRLAKAKNKKVIVDTSRNLLKKAIEEKPTMIKPNADEIADLMGIKNATREQVIEAAYKLHEEGIEIVAISLGKTGSIVIHDHTIYEVTVPEIDTVNSVGCGDSMIAGFAVALERNESLEGMIRLASATGTANALNEATGFVVMEDVERLMPQVSIKKVER